MQMGQYLIDISVVLLYILKYTLYAFQHESKRSSKSQRLISLYILSEVCCAGAIINLGLASAKWAQTRRWETGMVYTSSGVMGHLLITGKGPLSMYCMPFHAHHPFSRFLLVCSTGFPSCQAKETVCPAK